MRTTKICYLLISIFLCSFLFRDRTSGTEIKNSDATNYSHEDTSFINQSGVLNMDSNEKKSVTILYTNWKNVTSYRKIIPLSIEFKSSEWHKEEQWILSAFDIDKQDKRGFALKDIKEWKTSEIK